MGRGSRQRERVVAGVSRGMNNRMSNLPTQPPLAGTFAAPHTCQPTHLQVTQRAQRGIHGICLCCSVKLFLQVASQVQDAQAAQGGQFGGHLHGVEGTGGEGGGCCCVLQRVWGGRQLW